VRLILPGELAKHAISEGTKSVTSIYLALFNIEENAKLFYRILISGCEVKFLGSVFDVVILCTLFNSFFLFHPTIKYDVESTSGKATTFSNFVKILIVHINDT
jgi:hypothetical protein